MRSDIESHLRMSDDNQIHVPRSFVELFIPPHAIKPTASREHIAARYELCEDLAQMLSEQVSARVMELGVTKDDILERMHRGLLADAAVVDEREAWWVMQRLAELLG